MEFGAKPSPYSPELAVSEGLGAKLWYVKGMNIIFFSITNALKTISLYAFSLN